MELYERVVTLAVRKPQGTRRIFHNDLSSTIPFFLSLRDPLSYDSHTFNSTRYSLPYLRSRMRLAFVFPFNFFAITRPLRY